MVRDEPHDLLFEFHRCEVSSTSRNLDWSRSRVFLQCFRACVFHRKKPSHTDNTISPLWSSADNGRIVPFPTMRTVFVPLWMNCLLYFFKRRKFVVTTPATPESCAPCQFRKELVAQVSRSTVDDHVVDQSPFGALPEIECRLGAPKLKKSRRISPRSSGLHSNLAQSLVHAVNQR